MISKLAPIITREPVLFFAAAYATFEAGFPDASPALKLAASAWVAYLQRMFSTPSKKADAAVEVAKYVGAVEHQNITTAGAALAPPRRPLKAR